MKKNISGMALLAMCIAIFSSASLHAQSSKFFSELYIPDNASVSIFSKHTFHKGENGVYPGAIATERNNKKGYLNFAKGSSWVGASDIQYVDGYVKVYHDEAFTFPIGANSKFRPIAISGAARTSAAYYDNDPNFISQKGTSKTEASIHRITELEYWDIDGQRPTKITLTWNVSSGIEALTENDLTRLTIVGWKGNQWEVIPSSIDRFTLDQTSSKVKLGTGIANFSIGSITTNEAVKPNDYDYITLAALNPRLMTKIQPQFDVYPNPQILRSPINVNYQFASNQGGFIRLYSANNVLLLEKEISEERGTIQLPNSAQNAGVFVVGIIDRNGNANYQKLVVVEK